MKYVLTITEIDDKTTEHKFNKPEDVLYKMFEAFQRSETVWFRVDTEN